ncbi:MAG: hypothetical protein RLZZ450_6197 [Pseudomonadota bacterium]|jgi:hypothetical protein
MRLFFVFVLSISALFSSLARAQLKHDFSTVRYRPAVGADNYLGLESAQTAAHGQASYALAFDYSTDTLTVDRPCGGLSNVLRCTAGKTDFLQKTGLAHVLVGLGLFGNTQLALDLPLGGTDARPIYYDVGNVGSTNPRRSVRLHDGFVLGDARLQSKTRLFGKPSDKLQLAAAGFTTLPSGMLTSGKDCAKHDTCSFVGERGAQVGAFGVVEYAVLTRLRAVANLGALYRPKRDFLGTDVSSELSFGAALAYQAVRYFSLKAELVGALAFVGTHDVPLEARGGLTYGRDVVFTVGGGAGILGDVGSPLFRVFAGVQWTPVFRDADHDGFEDESDRCPRQAEDRDGFEDGDGCPDPDNDGDHILDALDKCDAAKEDLDGFQDEDGCPELDNDGDGVLDGYDTCEGEKEDIDGDHDDDGCPDLDTDRDGLLDAVDQCPLQAEDTDGLGDEDGCPDVDFDGDGVADTADACPEEPETKDGKTDEDGCPE